MIPLPTAGELMGQSWQFFCSHWKTLLKRSLWFLLAFVVYIVLALPAAAKQAWGAYAVVFIGFLFASILAFNHLCLYILREQSANATIATKRATDFLLPVLWIAILTAVSVSIASIAFVIPGIWLGLSLSFGYLFVLEDNVRGVDALKASYRLVKGRWWSTFWRIFAPVVAMLLIIWAISAAVWVIIGLVAGGSLFGLFFAVGNGASASANIASGFVGVLILAIVVVAGFLIQLATLFIAFTYPLIVRVKLFHALKQSANVIAQK